MRKEEISTFDQYLIEYYKGIVLFGVVMVAISIWIYEYHYTQTGDDILGIMASCALFFGTLVVGQGIRGWRDGEDFRNRFIHTRVRAGDEVLVRKRKKSRW
jgi:hypothetical protein